MRGRHAAKRAMLIVGDVALHVRDVARTRGIAGGVQPRDVVFHEDAIAVGGVEAEAVAAGVAGRLREGRGHGLDGKAVDLHVEVLGLVAEGGGGEGVVVVVQEGGHVVVEEVGVGAFADLVAGAGEGVGVVGLEEGRVTLRRDAGRERVHGVERVEDASRGRRPVVEEEHHEDTH